MNGCDAATVWQLMLPIGGWCKTNTCPFDLMLITANLQMFKKYNRL